LETESGEVVTTEEFIDLLQGAYDVTDEQLRSKYRRSLSFQDGSFDRWKRAKRLGFGEGTSVYNSALVYGDVTVGRQTWIGPNVILDGSGGGLTIGDFCSVSSGVHIYTHDTVLWALSGGMLPAKHGKVTIGSCVYVGSQSIIATGVSIGSRSVVGANTFVNRDVPEATVVVGTPARRIGAVVGEGCDVRIVFDAANPARQEKLS
jgi:acetyltransferase-like isoleucine patch superfamily enzyme